MDEIEYKLKTKNSVLVVNAIEKVIATIKSKYKPAEKQKFVLENDELKFLMEKCSSRDTVVSLTACQGLLSLVAAGVLDISYTMSTLKALLPNTHNYSAIISTMSGLLILDLKCRLGPNKTYKCPFSFKTPQHPFITILEKNPGATQEVLNQMHVLCTHSDYIVQSNCVELLRPVFLWLTCGPENECSRRVWELLIGLKQDSVFELLVECLCWQKTNTAKCAESTLIAYTVVIESAIHTRQVDFLVAIVPLVARLSNELIKHGRDPRACYSLIQRCFALDAPELGLIAGLTVALLADNLTVSSALHLHELFSLCLNITNKHDCQPIAVNMFLSQSLQWLHLTSVLTQDALALASKLLDSHRKRKFENVTIAGLQTNKLFRILVQTDRKICIVYRLLRSFERCHNTDKSKSWFLNMYSMNDVTKLDLVAFYTSAMFEEDEEICLGALKVLISLVNLKKETAVFVLPILLYKIASDASPIVKMECLKALPLMAKCKENVPSIVSALTKLVSSSGAPYSFLVHLHTILAEEQHRCFPYLQQLLARPGSDIPREIDTARCIAVKRLAEFRPDLAVELVPIISVVLKSRAECSGAASFVALTALSELCAARRVDAGSAWAAMGKRLSGDHRPQVQAGVCKFLSKLPDLYVNTPECHKLMHSATEQLWRYISEGNEPRTVEAACDALSAYHLEHYTLKIVPEIYRKTVKLPPSYCKTPIDAERKPEDVLDYIPCEIWPEVFKYTNQSALSGVSRLVSRLMGREIKSYRSGVYDVDPRAEPQSMGYLPPHSVVRGLAEFVRRQATSPTYDCSDTTLLSMLTTLASEFPKPLPPLDSCYIHDLYHRGALWKRPCLLLASRQAHTSLSAKRMVDNYLGGVDPEKMEESETEILFEILPQLCCNMPPNSLRKPIETCLTHSFKNIEHIKVKPTKKTENLNEYAFIKQLNLIKKCLDDERIHEANRTLLAQIVEAYFNVVSENNVSYQTYINTLSSLPTEYTERMTSPSSWWDVETDLVRRCLVLRIALVPKIGLNCLPEIIDAVRSCQSEHEWSLQQLFECLSIMRPDDGSRDWLLQLMARIQVAFAESQDPSFALYLFDVLTTCACALSDVWRVEHDAHKLCSDRDMRLAAFPSAIATLFSREGWQDKVAQVSGWLSHPSVNKLGESSANSCKQALIALRQISQFPRESEWNVMMR